ncbi:AIR synthase-related protein, partial [Mesorhizobium sp.]
IGGVGLIADWSKMARVGFAGEGQMIVLVGAPATWGSHLGQSVFMRDIHGRGDGPPPPVDLEHEKRVGDHVRALIASGIVTAAHDLSDGGLAVALAEMAMASGIGATIPGLVGTDPIPVFFGEDQGRYLLTLSIDPQSKEWDAIREEQGKLGIFAP